MPIAPITGKLRKGLWRDIFVALGLGMGAGYTYWYVHFSTAFFLCLTLGTRYGYHLKAGMTTSAYMITRTQSFQYNVVKSST
ncbi:hypothetical protein JVU11DRAFT_6512 [Chiua virens]|nr:hypothetical protein JVU11DRAFT_6512 [Chiua virens]